MKSPLKAKPLRNPGESIQNQLEDVLFDKVLFYFLLIIVFILLAGLEWLRYFQQAEPNPVGYSALALLISIFSVFKIYKGIKQLKPLKLGRDGEKAVGQYLEVLRESGAKVFHDIPGENFNLDHVVISESGIYVIETKTYSKPEKGSPAITFDGVSVTLDGRGTYIEPVIQVQAGTTWLRQLLKESTGREFPFRSVLVFPGWFVQPTAEAKNSDIWVLNPKALPAFIGNSKNLLDKESINLAAFHLSRYIRGYKK